MEYYLIALAVFIAGLKLAYNHGKSTINIAQSITDTVNQTATDHINQTINSIFAHYKPIIVEGTPEEASAAFAQVSVKIDNLKLIQIQTKKIENMLTNIQTYE